MKLQPIEFESGHKLTDNGLNDYDLICPEAGNVGFAHWGTVAMLTAKLADKNTGAVCSACRQFIGAQLP